MPERGAGDLAKPVSQSVKAMSALRSGSAPLPGAKYALDDPAVRTWIARNQPGTARAPGMWYTMSMVASPLDTEAADLIQPDTPGTRIGGFSSGMPRIRHRLATQDHGSVGDTRRTAQISRWSDCFLQRDPWNSFPISIPHNPFGSGRPGSTSEVQSFQIDPFWWTPCAACAIRNAGSLPGANWMVNTFWRIPPNSSWSNTCESDAMQHCVGGAVFASLCGPFCSKLLGIWYELWQWGWGSEDIDPADLDNGNIGADNCANASTPQEFVSCCDVMLQIGALNQDGFCS